MAGTRTRRVTQWESRLYNPVIGCRRRYAKWLKQADCKSVTLDTLVVRIHHGAHRTKHGILTEWLGTRLQNGLRGFDSRKCLQKVGAGMLSKLGDIVFDAFMNSVVFLDRLFKGFK